MKKVIIGLVVALTSLSALAGEGVVTVASTHSTKDTADKFVAIAQEKGLNVFARINHQENATKVPQHAACHPTPDSHRVFPHLTWPRHCCSCAQQVVFCSTPL
ncbi:hypothetical protein K6U54_18820, partial [Vibrio alginolyticus]|nr:hypothetical protein [Vibrio alginolyticus]